MRIDLHTREKLRAIVAQLDQLLLSDIPHSSTADGLILFRDFFLRQDALVARAALSSVPKLLASACVTANERIAEYLPCLGFFLRSTNVRNNFECFDVLAEMATTIIGPRAKVVISSEWEFSPLTYPLSVSVLPDYLLIGMPAPESGNALLLPLAGHELGHSVWVNDNLESKHASVVQTRAKEYIKINEADFKLAYPEHAPRAITDDELNNNIFFSYIVHDIVSVTLSQIEETFCDAVGLSLFGKSFAYAFHYLLAPSVGGQRAPHYPQLPTRALFMTTHGGLDFAAIGFPKFEAEFEVRQSHFSARSRFVVTAADHITSDLAPAIYREASNLITDRALRLMPDEDVEVAILTMFRARVPAKDPRSLSNILNAAWEYTRVEGPSFSDKDRPLFEWISELVFKTVEVLEFERRINA